LLRPAYIDPEGGKVAFDLATRTAVGTRGLALPPLGLGTSAIAGLYEAVGDDVASQTMSRALGCGVRYFDSAPLYGHGLAELRLGRELRGVERDLVVVSTKVGRLLRDVPAERESDFYGIPNVNPVYDYSADGVRRSLEESLERLGLDRVDILLVHDPDEHWDEAMAGAIPALVELRDQGVVRAIGAGMNQSAMLADFVREADIDCCLLAGRYTLLDQGGLEDLLPLCAARSVAVVAGGVFNSGLLADPRPGAHFDYRPADARLLERARALREVCRRHDVPLKAAAIQFPLLHPAICTVAVGARTAAEIAENVALLERELPLDMWRDLRAEGLIPEGAATPA
jgi:D-threo-aldose 1-dehydrogenase